jgi:hypothetical protein
MDSCRITGNPEVMDRDGLPAPRSRSPLEWVHSGRIKNPLGKPAKQQNRQVIATNLREVLLQALSIRNGAGRESRSCARGRVLLRERLIFSYGSCKE